MSKLKSSLVKALAVVFAVCSAFALAFISKTNVQAQEEASFEIVGTSIRNGVQDGLYGLQFTTRVNDAWIDENPANNYSFGTIIAPKTLNDEDNLANFDPELSTTENMEAMDADTIIAYDKAQLTSGVEFKASLIYDEAVVEEYLAGKQGATATVEEVLKNLYKQEYVAISYAILDGEIIYADAYVDTMYATALRALADENVSEEFAYAAIDYLGIDEQSIGFQTAYVSVQDNQVVVDSVEGYQANEETIIIYGGKVLTLDKDYTLSATGDIVLAGELTASKELEMAYVIDGNVLNVVEVMYVDQAISTAEELVHYFDPTTWAKEANPFAEVTVLANDIDMSATDDLYIETTKDFAGTFDGRGHVISNLTIAKSVSETVYAPLFGDLQNSAIIKNVAFDEITSLGYDVNGGLLSNNLRGTVENIYVKFSKTSEVQQVFMYATAGHLTNCIIEAPYNEDLDVDKWIEDHDANWGRTYLARMISTAAIGNMTNVKVITQLPLILYGEGNMAEPAYTDGAVSNWNNWFAYGENETELWHDFEYFYNATDDAEAPGLGLERGTATVQNTQVIVDDQSMKQGKTRVWKGVERYETLDEMVAGGDLSAFVESGMWKMENGKLVWAKDENVTTYIGGEYEAAENKLKSTALNGEVVKKVTVNGVELSLENGEYTVDENGYLTSIYGKKSANDPKNGISYKINSADNDILDEVIIYTESGKYELSFVNYYTRIIDNYDELKAVLQINYSIVATETATRESGNGVEYVIVDGKEYVYNAGIYKLGADIDMYNAETSEYLAIDYSTITLTNKDYYGYHYYDSSVILGGFTGVFDGDGYVISNFKPSKYGMFGILATTGSGLTTGADIKNVAFTNVLTTSADLRCPVIAAQMYNSDTIAQNISNVYVSYSASATDMYGLVYQPSGVLKMNNVYVVNETMYNAIDEGLKDNYYGIELEEGVTYRNVFPRGVNDVGIHEFSSSLFGSIRNMSNIGTSYINNVLVASPNLINYNNNFDFAMQSTYSVQHVSRTYTFSSPYNSRIMCSSRGEAYYYCSNCGYYYATAECTRCGEDAVLGSLTETRASSKSRSFGFAGNEVTSTVPVIKGFAPSIIKDLATAPYKAEDGTLINPFGALAANSKPGYVCDICGKHISLIKDSKCYDENCEGTMNVQATAKSGLTYEDYNSIWASPYAYEWTRYDLTSRTSTNTMSDTNAIVRFMGVTKYDTASEINENADLSSFKGSKVWAVTENGLAWASLVA